MLAWQVGKPRFNHQYKKRRVEREGRRGREIKGRGLLYHNHFGGDHA